MLAAQKEQLAAETYAAALVPTSAGAAGIENEGPEVVLPKAEAAKLAPMAFVVGGIGELGQVVVVFRAEGTSLVPSAVAVSEAEEAVSGCEEPGPVQLISAEPEWEFALDLYATPAPLITILESEGENEPYSAVDPKWAPTIQDFLEKVGRAWGLEAANSGQGYYGRGLDSEGFMVSLGDDETWRGVVALKSLSPVIYGN
jgi:hypothetical protein